jgi:hypothetical protein
VAKKPQNPIFCGKCATIIGNLMMMFLALKNFSGSSK